MNSSSRPGFTLKRTALNAVIWALPASEDGRGLLADQHRNEQEARDESQREQLEIFADRAPDRFRDGIAQTPLAEVAGVGRKGWTSEPHGQSLTWILPC